MDFVLVPVPALALLVLVVLAPPAGAAVVVAPPAANNRPMIGIMTQPSGSGGPNYLAASYVKWVESAGARAVPLFFDWPTDARRAAFDGVNGLLLPGGGASLRNDSAYYRSIRDLYGWAIEANANGDHFPVWGTCLGFEALGVLQSGSQPVLADGGLYDSENLSIPLNFTQLAASSPMLSGLGAELRGALATEGITLNNHHEGLSPRIMRNDAQLAEFFNVLATNVDRAGKEFCSVIEGKDMPVYGTQFHPEKNNFEWNGEWAFPHGMHAVAASQYFANWFVQQARMSSHSFPTLALEQAHAIFNYAPVFSGVGDKSEFTQEYRFAKTPAPPKA